ncbi:AbrB family transcriptional regulator [Paracoccaceae bacterium Fryx2]|nr:AbrB family transcriptional regulator [Paracoccaceae bacterium Fryx2]
MAIGAFGGGVFQILGLPLPWMLGALTASMIAAMLNAPILPPSRLRPTVVVVIGVLLGAGFSPALLSQAAGWALSLAMLVVYLVVTAALVVPYYRRVGGFDPTTAFFSAMPGGVNEMAMIGQEMGGDERRIILAHAARIVITIALIALWFRLIQGYSVGSATSMGVGFADIDARDLAVLAVCGVLGAALGIGLRLPAPTLVGPMFVSAAAHVAGLSQAAPPRELVVMAQILLGTVMGCRFLGIGPRVVGRALLLSLGATLLSLGVTLAFALLFHRLFGQSIEQVMLAYAPGGVTEMSLVALAMQAEVAYVATHHVVRIVLLVGFAPLVLRRIGRRPK